MKAIRCDLPFAEQIEIDPLGDLHIGDNMCDYKAIMARIEQIEKTPNLYCTLGGDLMDTAVCSSIGDTYGANLQPSEQLKHCVKIFEPIKDKILAVVVEKRAAKSIDWLTWLLLSMLTSICTTIHICLLYSKNLFTG